MDRMTIQFIDAKKPNIIGDTSFTDGLFSLTETLELKEKTYVKQPDREHKALSRTIEHVEINGQTVRKITTFDRIV